MREYFDSLGIEMDRTLRSNLAVTMDRIILAGRGFSGYLQTGDKETHEKLDKDRFRRDMGNVEDAYEEVFRRLGNLSKQHRKALLHET